METQIEKIVVIMMYCQVCYWSPGCKKEVEKLVNMVMKDRSMILEL